MSAYDLTNKKFEELTAKKIVKRDDSGHNYWQCECSCGAIVIVRATNLINGSVTMCKDCKKNRNKKVTHKDVKKVTSVDVKNNYDNITIMKNVSILNAPIMFNIVHAINADLTYSNVTKENNTYHSSLAGEYDKYFKIREQLDELSVCDWNVGDVVYTAPVYSLLTKANKKDKVTYDTVEQCLINLKTTALDNETFYLAFPKICCGKDGLDWDKVKILINNIFGDTEFEIILFE